MKKQVLILILIFILAIGLRLYKLGLHSYSGIEVQTITIASTSVKELLVTEEDLHAPLFRLLLHWWMGIFSKSEFATRLLSLLFGVVSIIPSYFLIRRLVNKKVAIIAAYLFAISPFYILFSRMTYDISFFLFLNSLSLFLFLYWCEENKGFLLYIITTILMLYSWPLPILTLAGEWIYFFIRWRSTKSKLKIWLLGYLALFPFYIHLGIIFLHRFSAESQALDRLPSTFGVISKAIYAFYSFSLGKTILPWNWKVVWPAAFVFVLILAFGLTRLKRKYRSLSFIMVFLLLPLAPIFTNRGAPEYCIGASLVYYILLAISIGQLRTPISIIAIGLITFFSSYSLHNLYVDKEYHTQSLTDNWRLIAKYVEQEVDENTIAIAYHDSFIWYYEGENLMILGIKNPEITEEKLKSAKKVLLVHTPLSGICSSDDQKIREFKEWLDRNFFCIQSIGFSENKDYEIKRKFLKRSFPRFRVQVFLYERGEIL